jgi:hypothetical protein
LHWVRLAGSESCIGGDALARDVERKLGRSVFPAARDAEVLIEGHVERVAGGFRAQLRMSRGDGRIIGSRELSSQRDDCGELSETVAVVLAVMIDPDAEGRIHEPEPAAPVAAPRKPAAKPPSHPDANRMSIFARVLLGVLATPEPSFGLGAAYERALGRAGGIRIEGVTFFETRVSEPLAAAPSAAVDLRLAYVGLAYCPLWLTLSRLRLAGCAGLEVGALQAQGVNLKPNAEDTQPWLSGSASLRLALRLVAALELQLGGSFMGTKEHRYMATVDSSTGQTEQIGSGKSFGAAFDLGLGARF